MADQGGVLVNTRTVSTEWALWGAARGARLRRRVAVLSVFALVLGIAGITGLATTSGASTQQLDLKILLIGGGAGDPTTSAWQATLDSEGVPYTLVTATGSYGSESVTLPALSDGSHGYYNGVVIADSPWAFTWDTFLDDGLDAYESEFGVRQIDGYIYPSSLVGLTDVSAGPLDGTTATLTTDGTTVFPELAGPVPMDTGTYGYSATVNAGAPFTPLLDDASGNVLAGIYQHPSSDPQSNVAELVLNFDYNQYQLQWLLLGPGLIDWVTQGEHLGLWRNYFGQDVDDTFLSDNEWSAQFQCTPGATDPPDVTCPAGVANNPADTPPDQHMDAADVAYVANWEQQTGIRLELAFNAQGACSQPSVGAESDAVCDGTTTVNGSPYTDPGHMVEAGAPANGQEVDALLANQSSFNWVNHTWSHQFLGCTNFQPLAVTSAQANAGGTGSLSPGDFTYEITAVTAYGESEPSTPQVVTVAPSGSVTFTWPDATNGGGPSLAQLEAQFGGGSGFWGYNIYREDPWEISFSMVGQVSEDPGGATSTYSYTDTGATGEGAPPTSTASYPTATNPGTECADGGWEPATSSSPDSSIEQEVGLNDAFAAANGLTSFDPSAVVTGEHSGVENPNMPAALAGVGLSSFATDASRQIDQYALTYSSGSSEWTAFSSPRYPSNIYYNAANWPDEINEYNTLYVASGDSLGDSQYPSETGRCVNTPSTTCRTTPAAETDIVDSESRIDLGHILDNDPRMAYAHQSNLVGPATVSVDGQPVDYGYTLLRLLDHVLAQYEGFYTVPFAQMTDATSAATLQKQNQWSSALQSGDVTASFASGQVTVTNNGPSAVQLPVSLPTGSTFDGSVFGQTYGASSSDWASVGPGDTLTFDVTPPVITSAASATFTENAPGTFTVAASGNGPLTYSATGDLPSGVSLSAGGILSGTPAFGTAGTYPFTITATDVDGLTANQAFTLTVDPGNPEVTSGAAATFTEHAPGTFTVSASGDGPLTLTETGSLPAEVTFTDNGSPTNTDTATLAGTPAFGTAGTYPFTVTATDANADIATQAFVLTIDPGSPGFSSTASTTFTETESGTFTVSATGDGPLTLTETGTLPAGITFTDNVSPTGTDTATLAGTPAPDTSGTYSLTLTATDRHGNQTEQSFTLTVSAVFEVTTTSLPPGQKGVAYTTILSADQGKLPYKWKHVGALPRGLRIAASGVISGVPKKSGTFVIVVRVTDASRPHKVALAILKIVISP